MFKINKPIPIELFSNKIVFADGYIEVVAYTWDFELFQVDIIEDEKAFCEFAKRCTPKEAITYAKKRIQEIETLSLKEKVSILEKKNQNNMIVRKILAIAKDTTASYGEIRNAVTIASRILSKGR